MGWLLTLRLANVEDFDGDPTMNTGAWPCGTDGKRVRTTREDHCRCAGPPSERSLEPVHATKLGTPADEGQNEMPTLTISEDGRYLAAVGEGAGFWLLDAHEPAEPEVVAGLWKGQIVGEDPAEPVEAHAFWHQWNPGNKSIDLFYRLDQNATESKDDRGADEHYPVWPVPGTDAPRVSEPDEPLFQSISNPVHAAALVGSVGERFLFLNTQPVTAWRFDPDETPGSNPLYYVGALCATGRLRVSIVGHRHLYFAGNEGAFTVPLCIADETESDDAWGCCGPVRRHAEPAEMFSWR